VHLPNIIDGGAGAIIIIGMVAAGRIVGETGKRQDLGYTSRELIRLIGNPEPPFKRGWILALHRSPLHYELVPTTADLSSRVCQRSTEMMLTASNIGQWFVSRSGSWRKLSALKNIGDFNGDKLDDFFDSAARTRVTILFCPVGIGCGRKVAGTPGSIGPCRTLVFGELGLEIRPADGLRTWAFATEGNDTLGDRSLGGRKAAWMGAALSWREYGN